MRAQKSGMRLLLGLAILITAGIVARPEAAQACSCAAPSSVEQEVADSLKQSAAIFVGKVTKVVPPPRKWIMSTADETKVHFEVIEVWKGRMNRETVILTAMSSASCGYEGFAVGTDYLVTANNPEKLSTNICAMTMPLADASTRLAILGTGYLPLTDPADESKKGTAGDLAYWPTVIVAAAAAIAAVGIVVLVKRKRRKIG